MLPSSMFVAKPTQLSRPSLRVLCVRRLPRPGRGVKTRLQPHPTLSPLFTTKSRKIRTYEKRSHNPFRMNTSKTLHLKSFRIRTYKKTGEGPRGTDFSLRSLPVTERPPRKALRTHSNPCNFNPLINLLHDSLDTPGVPPLAGSLQLLCSWETV